MTFDLRGEVRQALKIVTREVSIDELAYLACTGKVEHNIRDRVAWLLHRRLSPSLVVAREWRRIDLAILGDGVPSLIMEFKAMYGFNIAGARNAPAEYHRLLDRDAVKCRRWPDSDRLLVALVTHVDGTVPTELLDIVKYAGSINRYPLRPDDEALVRFIAPVGEVLEIIPMGHGSAFGLSVDLRALVWSSRDNNLRSPQTLPV